MSEYAAWNSTQNREAKYRMLTLVSAGMAPASSDSKQLPNCARIAQSARDWASDRPLHHVLDARRQANPSMHAFFVDGKRGDGKTWIRKRAYRHGNILFVVTLDRIVNRCPTFRAEAENDLASFVADPDVLTRLTADRHRAPRESRLSTEDTPGSALTRQAMADGNPNWFGSGCECQLTAAARRCSDVHWQ